MKKVILVSICIKRMKRDRYGICYTFHFKGYLNGEKISSIEVVDAENSAITVGEEYILYLELKNAVRGVLQTKMLNYKELKNICYVYN